MKFRNIHIVFASALFGILAWGSVTLREQYLITVDAPFVLENIPDGLAVKSPLPTSLQLKMRGSGWHLAAITIGGNPRVAVSALALPPGNRAMGASDILEHLSFGPGVQLIDVKPESIRVEFDHLARKRVPVVLDEVLGLREGYGQVGQIVLSPDSVTITGAESILRGIDSWKTRREIFENVKAPIDANVPLAPSAPYRLTFSDPGVRVMINVEPYAEKTFTGIAVEVREVPSNREVILIPPKMELVVRAGIKQLSSLSLTDFHVITFYYWIAADTTGSVDTDIIAPPGAQVVSKKPERIQYIVRKRL
jgi:hypothetical protein